MKEKVLLSWSGGKDSALALYELDRVEDYCVEGLLTTISFATDRVSMHGVRRELLEQQAKALELPIEIMSIPQGATDEQYQSEMRRAMLKYREMGVTSVVFGDIFLEELREYREDRLSKVGMRGVFPLWQMDSMELAHRFVDLGFRAIITCVDLNTLDGSFVGQVLDNRLLSILPDNVDPCGENGEFHSFVYDGPIFRYEVLHEKGDVLVIDDRFRYCDLLSVSSGRPVSDGVA